MPQEKWTHCKKGHPLSVDNIRTQKNGTRRCLKCQSEYNRNYKRDPEKKKTLDIKYAKNNPEKCRDIARRYREKNREAIRKRARVGQAIRRNQGNFSPWMLRYYRYAQDNRCFYCGIQIFCDIDPYHPQKEHLEHMTPVIKGGQTSWTNTVLSCASCNHRKGSKTVEEFIDA